MSINRDKWGNIIGLDEEDRIMSILNNYSPNAAQMKALFEMIGAMPSDFKFGIPTAVYDPNTVEGMFELERRVAIEGLRKPFTLCMTRRTWEELISAEVKEFIIERMDTGEYYLKLDEALHDKQNYIEEHKE